VWPRFDAERSLKLFAITMADPAGAQVLRPPADALTTGEPGALGRRHPPRLSALVRDHPVGAARADHDADPVRIGGIQILLGRDTGWHPQRRDDGSIPFRDIVRRHRWHVALGVVTLIAGLLIAPSLVAWMSPTIAGLIFAILLSWGTAQLGLGLSLKRLGLLRTPEETAPPPIATRANALARELEVSGADGADSLRAIHDDPELREKHEAFLPNARPRHRGEITAERALAVAKLTDAETIEDAMDWLKPKERNVVLHDRALIALLCMLPSRAQTRG
jgi:membrane glycosyltransferase